MKGVTDEQISEAIWICRKYEKVSPPLLERVLSLDFDTAENIFRELETAGVIQNIEEVSFADDDEIVEVGEVNKDKLAEFSKN